MQAKTETIVGAFILAASGLFIYMTFFFGVFRWDKNAYNTYFVYCQDVSGLEKKGKVKVAGLTVGWIEAIELESGCPKVTIVVNRACTVRKHTYAVVRQEGFLSGNYVELVPGEASSEQLEANSCLETVCQPLRSLEVLTKTLEKSAVALEGAALHAQGSFKHLSCAAQKVNEGKGLVGKLINEDETYRDISFATQGLRKYFNQIDALNIVFDSHSEYMYSPAEQLNFENAKGYLDIRIHPNDDNFYLVQILNTERGNIKRSIKDIKWFDERCVEIIPSEFVNMQRQTAFLPELVGTVEKRKRKLDQLKFGIQFGKIYKDIVFRIGIIESSAGFGIDIDIPFPTDAFRWITTFEMFDVRGRDRIDDSSPHLKWINRVFLVRNFYVVAGADDFVSKHNATGFVGAGIRFCDDDIKYFLSSLALFGIGAGA